MRHASRISLAFTVASAVGLAGSTRAADWPRFRGPDASGRLTGTGVFDVAELGLQVAWKRPLGSGYSGISVVGDVAVTMFADGDSDFVIALDAASGKERWRHRLAEMYAGHDSSHDGPSSTPLIADGVVYALGPRGDFVALGLADGALRWRHDLDSGPAERTPFYGYSTAPLVVGEAIVVAIGGPVDRAVVAFARVDGRVLWSWGGDTVGHQSPLLVAALGGRRQLLVATNDRLAGLDPASGKRLWEHPTRGLELGNDRFEHPVDLGEGRFLLAGWAQSVALRVTADGEAWKVEELWRTSELRGSFGLPVLHDGLVYGWGGAFLTCLDPATGAVVWKSRPPGGRDLTVVDGHVAVVGRDGAFVVGRVSRDGFEERARVPLFDGPTYTAPSFAGGRFFVRDLAEIAALEIVEPGARPVEMATSAAVDLPPGLAALVAAVEGLADPAAKSERVDAYLAAQTAFPAVEGGDQVVFLYRGEARDVALVGSVVEGQDDLPLTRLAGTDLFYAALRLEPDLHYEYGFGVDFADPRPDPRNPLLLSSLGGEVSELRMPGWPAEPHLAAPSGPRGRLEAVRIPSAILGNERELRVYLPPGYDAGGAERYPLLVVTHGTLALENTLFNRSLDNLIGRSVRPLIAAFVPRLHPEEYVGRLADHSRFLARELVPALAERYRLESRPASRGVAGVASGALAALHAAFAEPETFGKAAGQSLIRLDDDLLRRIADRSAPAPVLYLDVSRREFAPSAELDAAVHSRTLVEAVRKAGYPIVVQETAGIAGPGHWRAQHDDILELFFPLE